MASFEERVAEGVSVPVEGWDFSWFDGRATEERPPWGYAGLLAPRLATAQAVLDVETGGGEVLAGVATRRLFNELKGRDPGRLLVVDLPPVLLSDDALMVAPLLDAVVLVVNERRTKREDVIRVVELLGNTRIVGTVLNRASESEKRAY